MEWAAETLYAKARLYMERAHEEPLESPLFAFWVSLALELLCRAALAKVHPVLLADPREDGSILYAFGVQPSKRPKSIVTKAIVIRCTLLVDGFTEEMASHCALMADRRNAELHSGAAAFDSFDNAAWLPATFEAVEVLLRHLGTDFNDFLGVDHAGTALRMLRDRRESIKKEVQDRIAGARTAYAQLSAEERSAREQRWGSQIAELLAANPVRRKVGCPACGQPAVVTGDTVSRGPVHIDESNASIEREVRVLPTQLTCPHCGLKLDGFQEMRQASFGAIYTVSESEDPVEFFGIDPSDYIDADKFVREYLAPEYDNE